MGWFGHAGGRAQVWAGEHTLGPASFPPTPNRPATANVQPTLLAHPARLTILALARNDANLMPSPVIPTRTALDHRLSPPNRPFAGPSQLARPPSRTRARAC